MVGLTKIILFYITLDMYPLFFCALAQSVYSSEMLIRSSATGGIAAVAA